MTETTSYQIVFLGEIAPGQHIDEVKRKFAMLYNKNVATIEQVMFTGKPVIVKKHLDHQTAQKIMSSLIARTGGMFEIVPVASTPPTPQTVPEPPPQSSSDSLPETSQQNASSGRSSLEENKEKRGEQRQASPETAITVEDRIGFWPRLAASVVDLNLMILVSFPLGLLFGGLLGGLAGGLIGKSQELAGAGLFLGSFSGMLIGLLLSGDIYNLIEGLVGASPGKMMIGVLIANADGSKANLGKLLARYALKNIAYLLSLLAGILGVKLIGTIGGLLGILWFFGCFLALGSRRQALHDRILDTAVYYRKTLQQKVPSDFPLQQAKKKRSKEGKGRTFNLSVLHALKPKLTFRQFVSLSVKFMFGLLLGILLGVALYYNVVIPYLINRFIGL